jgi:hypothetical protein
MAATTDPATGDMLGSVAHSGGIGSVGFPSASAGPTYKRGFFAGQKVQPPSKPSGMLSTHAGAQQKSFARSELTLSR